MHITRNSDVFSLTLVMNPQILLDFYPDVPTHLQCMRAGVGSVSTRQSYMCPSVFLGAESLCAWHIINSCWLNEYFKNWLSFSILTGQNHESQIGNRNSFLKKIFTYMNLLWVLPFCAYSHDHKIYSIVYIIHDSMQGRFLNLLHIMCIHYKISQ